MTPLEALADYAASQKTTGLLVVRRGETLLARDFPLGEDSATFAATFVRGRAASGALMEDVASQQKAVIAILAGQAIDRGLLDTAAPVSSLIGEGWTKVARAEEATVSVRHLLEMTSGLTEGLELEAQPGARFFYNTPAYSRLQRVLEAAAAEPLDALTRRWLTGPLGMADTVWLARPPELAQASGNAWGLVTAAEDLAKLGRMILDRGLARDGTRLLSKGALDTIFAPTATNPAYGRLWWLNSGAWSVNAEGQRTEGRLLPMAPRDLVLALGAHRRILAVSPSLDLIVVRLGQTPPDEDFNAQFWTRVMAAIT